MLFKILLITLSQSLIAQTCNEAPTDIRRNDEHLGPTRDQDSIGYCYAFSAADLYEQWLKKNGHMPLDQHVSGVGLGLVDHSQAWDERTRRFNSLGLARNTNLSEISSQTRDRQRELDALRESVPQRIRQGMSELPEYPNFVERLTQYRALGDEDPQKAALRSELEATLSSMEQSVVQNDPTLATDQRRQFELESNIESQWAVTGLFDFEETDVNQFRDQGLSIQGGKSDELLQNHWNSFCFESEVNSSDLDVRRLYESYRELYEGMTATPDDLSGGLGFLNSMNHEDRNQCANFTMATTMFPGLPFQDLESFTAWVGQGNLQGSVVQGFLNEACRRKAPPVQPQIAVTTISEYPTFPITGNENVLEAIESSLSEGKIASIGYNVDILFGDMRNGQYEFLGHESLVVGKANLCGAESYIVRNTYGEEMCDYTKNLFDNNPRNIYRLAFSETYQCDDQGNFIIPKRTLRDAIYSATTISN